MINSRYCENLRDGRDGKYMTRFLAHNKQIKLTRQKRLKQVVATLALGAVLVGTATGYSAIADAVRASSDIKFSPEANVTEVYLDPKGTESFSSLDELVDFCQENNYETAPIKWNQDAAGEITIGLSSLVHGQNEVSPSKHEPVQETNLGEIYNDPNGFTFFESQQELEKYCNDNNYDIYSIMFNQDSAGGIVVANSSFVMNNSKERTM